MKKKTALLSQVPSADCFLLNFHRNLVGTRVKYYLHWTVEMKTFGFFKSS